MRIAIVSDIHGNLSAFEAVEADLRRMCPDSILHGGDLADSGASPAEIVDAVRDLGWQGVIGNTDEMLARPESLEEFARQSSPALQPMFKAIREQAAATRELLGEERLAWLGSLPRMQSYGSMALVHGSPESAWRAPMLTASDEELEALYGALGRPVAVYAHIHRAYVRVVRGLTVANTGSVSLSHDGDSRAAYLLVDEGKPEIRRVEYDVTKETKALSASGLPHAEWTAGMLLSGCFEMP